MTNAMTLSHRGSIEALATVAARLGLSPEFAQGQPSTDGQTVFLPLPAEDEEPSVERLRTMGHGVHELMHLLSTDMKLFMKLDTSEKLYTNIFEDVRIDAEGVRRIPSYNFWRRRLVHFNMSKADLNRRMSKEAAFGRWLHMHALANAGVTWFKPWQEAAEERVQQLFGPEFVDKAKVLVDGLRLTDTAACIRAAKEVLKLFGDAEGVRKEAPDVDVWDPSSLRMVLLGAMPGVEPAQQTAASAADCDGGSTTGNPFGDTRVAPGSERYTSDTFGLARAEYGDEFDKHRGQIALQSRRLRSLLPKADEAEEGLADSGPGIGSFLPYAACRSTRIFARDNGTRRSTKARITILLDRSGSMGIRTMTECKVTVAALVEAIRKIAGVRSEVFAFPGAKQGQDIVSLKSLDVSEKVFLERLRPMAAYGSTPVHSAVSWLWQHLRGHAQDNNLLLIITDGRFPPTVEHCNENFSAIGVETALLSVDVRNENFIDNSEYVQTPEEIAQAVYRLLERSRFRRRLGH